MTITLTIDDVLLEHAHRIGKLRTKKETVTQALTEFIQRRRRLQRAPGISSCAWCHVACPIQKHALDDFAFALREAVALAGWSVRRWTPCVPVRSS